MKLFKWANWNDQLSLLLISAIMGTWLWQAWTKHGLPGEVNGALIATFTLVVQYYFRQRPPADQPPA